MILIFIVDVAKVVCSDGRCSEGRPCGRCREDARLAAAAAGPGGSQPAGEGGGLCLIQAW